MPSVAQVPPRGRPALLVFALLWTLAGCEGARSLSSRCSLNRDCAQGERCVSGACQPETTEGLCVAPQDCAAGEACVGGRCSVSGALPCASNADCPASYECGVGSGLCVPSAGAVCSTSGDCPVGQLCSLGECKDEAILNRVCDSDEACEASEICHAQKCTPGCAAARAALVCGAGTSCEPASGRCRPDVTGCGTDADCGSAAICVGGQCAVRCDLPGGLVCTGGFRCDSVTGRCGADSSCATDEACGAPAGICEAGRCVPGCGQLGLAACSAGSVCDTNRGRCVTLQGPCAADSDCGPPSRVCESGQCVGGCAQAGGLQCAGATACNPASGRCGAGGPFCSDDTDCPSGEVCNLLSGLCSPGCQTAGCPSGESCQASGHCTSRSCGADPFEPNDSRAAARELALGNYGGLTLCRDGDEDFYGFDLLAGDPLEIQIFFRHAEGDIDLELLDPNGQVVASSASTTDNEALVLVAPSSGRYVLRAFMGQDLGPNPGNTYSLDLALGCGEDRLEPNDTEAAARSLSLPASELELALCPENDDFYGVQLTAGQTVRITTRFSDAEGDIDLRLIRPSGTTAESASSTSDDETIEHTATETGRHVLRVFLFSDAGRRPGNRYDLSIEVVGAAPSPSPTPTPTCPDDRFEPNDSATSAAPIAPGLHPNLRLCSGDLDFFHFDLLAGDQVRVDLRFSHAEGDIDAQVTGPSGAAVATAASSTNDEVLSFTAATAGRYVLRATLFSDSGTSPGNDYSLELRVTGATPECTEDEFEPNDTSATAPPLWPGSYPGLSLCPGDDDFYAIGLVVEDRVTVSLSFAHAEGDIDLTLLGPSGAVVASSASSTDDESLTYVAAQSGLYRIRARLFGDTGSQPGNSYAMSVSLTPPASCQPDALESNDSPSSPRAIQLGAYLSLTACEVDDDWYSLSLSAGTTYTIAALFSHSEGDIDVGLFDAAGAVVASSVSEDDDEVLQFTPTTSGTYRVLVRLFEDAGTTPGNRYDLAVLGP